VFQAVLQPDEDKGQRRSIKILFGHSEENEGKTRENELF
jgi:hypothetical protein